LFFKVHFGESVARRLPVRGRGRRRRTPPSTFGVVLELPATCCGEAAPEEEEEEVGGV
jgi:hypothetical protein